MDSTAPPGSYVGEQVPLSVLGARGYGTVVAQAWSPALGRVLRVYDRSGQTTYLVYGDLLALLFPQAATPAA